MNKYSGRWKDDSGARLAVEVIERLKKGESLENLGLGLTNGRVDLRGLPASPINVSAPQRVGGLAVQTVSALVELNRVPIVGLDLTGALLSDWRIRGCQLINCRFDLAHCQQWVLWDSEVRGCTFEGSRLRGSLLGTYPEGGQISWENVTFRNADLRYSSAYGAAFMRCDFSDARLDEFHFNQCRLERCRFAGRVEGAVFDGRKLEGRNDPEEIDRSDFSDAYLVNVEFRGYSLQNLALPRDEDVRLIRTFPCVAKEVLQALRGDESKPAQLLAAALENSLRGPQTATASDVFNRRDWRAWGGDELLALADAQFRQAESKCRGLT